MKLRAAVWSQAEVHALIHTLLDKGFSVMFSEEVAKLHAWPISIFLLLHFLIFLIAIGIIRCLSLVMQKVLESPFVNLCRNMKEKDVSEMASL